MSVDEHAGLRVGAGEPGARDPSTARQRALATLRRRSEHVMHDEVETALARFDDLDEREREVVREMARSIVGGVLDEPVAAVLSGQADPETVEELFDDR